jgi:hypothetical protein
MSVNFYKAVHPKVGDLNQFIFIQNYAQNIDRTQDQQLLSILESRSHAGNLKTMIDHELLPNSIPTNVGTVK